MFVICVHYFVKSLLEGLVVKQLIQLFFKYIYDKKEYKLQDKKVKKNVLKERFGKPGFSDKERWVYSDVNKE